ncbi:DUF6192 family protein [Actinoplanes flavus]|uniref:Uncharacterized protein n=1 Tax=Actinoplanes flavus TaxID=2820290 RepID=A0ABS3V0K1_9ACTN|nr:DUF6192 family protein [Actinoplanes flavus]MBO3744367.1 hypothetical protein [Actinoplanes flavus]
MTVSQALAMFAEDIGAPATTVKKWRWVASRWPREHRCPDASFTVHAILAEIPDAQQRFAAIAQPPVIARTGERRWSPDEASRRVGSRVAHPASVEEKVVAVHDLVRDEKVASRVAADLLRRPDVAFKAMTETTVQEKVVAAQELVRDEESPLRSPRICCAGRRWPRGR